MHKKVSSRTLLQKTPAIGSTDQRVYSASRYKRRPLQGSPTPGLNSCDLSRFVVGQGLYGFDVLKGRSSLGSHGLSPWKRTATDPVFDPEAGRTPRQPTTSRHSLELRFRIRVGDWSLGTTRRKEYGKHRIAATEVLFYKCTDYCGCAFTSAASRKGNPYPCST